MQNPGDETVKRIFVKVFGFSDVERHALNTVFRLSESRPLAYSLWSAEAPEKAQVLLLDGDSWEAALELANPAHDTLKLVWVGDQAPAKAWKTFARPLQWAAVVEAMDEVFTPVPAAAAVSVLPAAAAVSVLPAASEVDIDFDIFSAEAPPAVDIDFDLDFDLPSADAGASTDPMPLEPVTASVPLLPVEEPNRVLVIDADRDARLYLRAKLSSAGLVLVDEAATAAEAQDLLRFHVYRLVVLDLDLIDMSGWKMMQHLTASEPPIAHVILTGHGLSLMDRLRAWLAGASGALPKPLHPSRLLRLLKNAKL